MSMIRRIRSRAAAGFTLIESVVVITLIGIIAAIAAVFLVEPFRAATDMARRAELVESAETALDRMTREIRLAVPNSVRLESDADGTAIEFLRAPNGGRYRRLPAPGGSGDPLNRVQSSDSFDVLGGIRDNVDTSSPSPVIACGIGGGDCLVINNTGTEPFNAYKGDNLALIVGETVSGGDVVSLTYDTAGRTPAFRSHSPTQRFQVIDTVVSYVCDAGELRRHFDYGITNNQTTTPGGTSNLVAEDVASCSFDYEGGAGQRHGLVTIDLTIQREGETVRLVDQAHVVNVP
jgi:MSHA biogenesis protein MshO